MEVLSPELVLIDADLAAEARSALATPPDVFDTLARARAGDTVRRLRVSFDAQEAEAAAEAVDRRRRPASRRWFAGAALLAAGALTATAAAVETLGGDEVTTARALASTAPAATPHRQAQAPAAAPKPAHAARTPVRRRVHPTPATAKRDPAPTVHPVAARRPAVPAPRRAPAVRATPANAGAVAATAAKAAPKVGTAAVRPQPSPVLTWPIQRRATYYRVAVYRLGRSPGFLFEVWTDKTRVSVPATWGSAAEHNRLARGQYGWAVFPAFGALGEAPADRAGAAPITGGRFTV